MISTRKKKHRCLSQLMRWQTRKIWVNNWSRSSIPVFQSNQTKEKSWILPHPQLNRLNLPTLLSRSSIPLFNLSWLNQLRTTPRFQVRSARQPHWPLQLLKNPKQLPNHPQLLSDPPHPRVNLSKNVPFLLQIAILSLRAIIWNHNHWQLPRNRLCKTEIASISWLVRMLALVCSSRQEICPVSKENSQHRSTRGPLLLNFYHLSPSLRKRS